MRIHCPDCGANYVSDATTDVTRPPHYQTCPSRKKEISNDPLAGRGYYEEDAPGYDEAS